MNKALWDSKTIRFLVVGGFNTVVGLATYPILYFLLNNKGVGYLQLLVLSYLITMTVAFVNLKKIVFKTKGGLDAEIASFLIFHLLVIGINFIILPVMVEIFDVNPAYGQFVFSLGIMISSYFWHDKITFKRKI